ncbi:hypothetical protein [Magnetospirillum molischianum]|nr:hypothetical protein [Magnetospirillum molischianum]
MDTKIILDALQQVKAEILSGIAPDTAIAEAAEDFSLNPSLIERKFRESYKTDIKSFSVERSNEKTRYLVAAFHLMKLTAEAIEAFRLGEWDLFETLIKERMDSLSKAEINELCILIDAHKRANEAIA